MLRVTSGIAKNRKLKSPDIEGFRAIQEKAKLSVFAILGEKIQDAVVLDLFAGSGNMGIEALSRGAKWCDFVDSDRNAVEAINENLRTTDLWEKGEVFRSEAVKFLAGESQSYDIIFIDPFYKDTAHKYLFGLLPHVLKKDGLIYFFHGSNFEPMDYIKNTILEYVETRRFGESYFSIYRLGAAQSDAPLGASWD